MRLWHIRFDRQKLKRGSDESIVHALPLRPLDAFWSCHSGNLLFCRTDGWIYGKAHVDRLLGAQSFVGIE